MSRSRGAAVLGALALALTVTVPGPSDAAGTTLGSTFIPTGISSCGTPDVDMVQTAAVTVPSARAGAAGVITSWSTQVGDAATTLTLRVFRATTTAGSYLVVADGGPLQSLAASSGVHTFPARVPIQSGDFIGLHGTVGKCNSSSGNSGDVISYRYGTVPAVGGTDTLSTSTSFIVDISATLEPDADGDGYGDLTQDACPQSALTQAPCPAPDTTITKKPKNPHAKKSKLSFTSTVPGSTFACTIDKKRAEPCTSPAKYTCLKPGKHTFSVLATSPFGIVAATPATAKFKVRAPRRGC